MEGLCIAEENRVFYNVRIIFAKGENNMKFATILKNARAQAAKADISGVDFLAIQVNIEGEDGGTFYVEVKDGNISVEPYEYYDRQCMITIDGDSYNKVVKGKLDPVKAYEDGVLKAEGDLGKGLDFTNLFTATLKK